jgi:toxin ParE1/3/4
VADLRLTSAALADLAEIDEYGVAAFGDEAAEAYSRGLSRIFDMLEQYPRSAPARPDYGEGIRCRAYREHLVLHTVDGDNVLIVRVLRHSRDVRRALQA